MGVLRLKCCSMDQAVFWQQERDILLVVLVYVHDCTSVGLTVSLIDQFKCDISSHIEISDLLGSAHNSSWVVFPCDNTPIVIKNNLIAFICGKGHRYQVPCNIGGVQCVVQCNMHTHCYVSMPLSKNNLLISSLDGQGSIFL